MTGPIRILVSACLLGEKVRYDGGHKRDLFLDETLGPFVEWVRVCPEVDCGLPVPREAMRLVGDPKHPMLVTNRTGIDHTERMKRWAATRLEELSRLDLCGYICKKDSPSSGMERVKVYGSGLISSPGESRHALSSDQVDRRPFDLDRVCDTSFEIDKYQPVLYVLDSFEQLRDVSVASRANKPIGDKMIMNAAFLIARDQESAFDARVKQIATRFDKLTFKYTGPWPPYNFVNIRLKLERVKDSE